MKNRSAGILEAFGKKSNPKKVNPVEKPKVNEKRPEENKEAV